MNKYVQVRPTHWYPSPNYSRELTVADIDTLRARFSMDSDAYALASPKDPEGPYIVGGMSYKVASNQLLYIQNGSICSRGTSPTDAPASGISISSSQNRLFVKDGAKLYVSFDYNLLFLWESKEKSDTDLKVYAFLITFLRDIFDLYDLYGHFTPLEEITDEVADKGKQVSGTERLIVATSNE